MTCKARQYSDQMSCVCGLVWDVNDPDPPKCTAMHPPLAKTEEDMLLSRVKVNKYKLAKMK